MKKIYIALAALLMLSLLLTGCTNGEKSLSVSGAAEPGEYRPGSQVTIQVQVENVGRTFSYVGADVDQFGDAELTSADNGSTITWSKTVVTDDATNRQFQRGQIISFTYRFTIPEDAVPGKYDLSFWIFGQKEQISDAVTILPAEDAPGPDGESNVQTTAAIMEEIENAWLATTGMPLGGWCEEDGGTLPDGARYYGTYGDYDIIFLPTGDDAITELEIEDVTFKHNITFDIYAYRDGSFTPLEEAYAGGGLTRGELRQLALRHLTYETRRVQTGSPAITQDIQQGMKLAFLQQFVAEDGHTASELTVTYYGEYDGAHVGFVHGILHYTQAFTSETVGGVTFRYSTGQKLLVFFEGELMSLAEAYESGILTQEHLRALHDAYAPKDNDNFVDK